MRNINLLKQNPLSYSRVIYNSRIDGYSNYKKILQTKIALLGELIQETYLSMWNFIFEYLKTNEPNQLHDEELYVIDELLLAYKNLQRKGIPIIDEILNQINGKEVNDDDFDLLIKIIEHQESITRDIVERDISFDRLEIIMNHLNDLPYYLRTDLEIEALPTIQQSLVNFSRESESTNGLTVIKTDYNPFDKEIA